MNTTSAEKYFLFTLLLLVIIFTIIIFYPFLTVFVLACSFAVILNPIYLWIKGKLRNISWLASLLTILIFILGLCLPLFFIGKLMLNQIQELYTSIINIGSGGYNQFMEAINSSINKILPTGFNFDIYPKITEFITYLSGNLGNFFSSILNYILTLGLIMFSLFFLLKDGEKWKNGFINIFPLKNEDTNEILINLKDSVNRIFRGSFIIGIIQGLLAGIGLAIFGVPSAVLFGSLAAITSFIPTVGTSIITVPAMIYLFATGHELQALGLLIWAIIVVSTVDNILSPFLISKNTEMHPILILFSILGAIVLMGPLGILVGPLVLSLLYSLISIYKKEC